METCFERWPIKSQGQVQNLTKVKQLQNKTSSIKTNPKNKNLKKMVNLEGGEGK